MQDYSKLLYGNEEPKVELFDEGAGVSGQKRIDQRQELDRLYRNMRKGIVGAIVMAREDRLFRNKHMDQVGVFTKLAEEKRIKVIIPPISSASTEEKTRVYDFTIYREIARLHRLLENFDAVWPTFDPIQRQRAFSLLINRIEVEVVSPHWLRLSIDWLDAICPRVDVAYVWKKTPSKGDKFSEEEQEIIRQFYPTSARLGILQLLPERTWDAIHTQAVLLHVERTAKSRHDIPYNACYRDLVPKLDGNYLLGDYQTTVEQIAKANANTSRKGSPLYPIWILPVNVANLSQGNLMLAGYGGGLPMKQWLLSLEGATQPI